MKKVKPAINKAMQYSMQHGATVMVGTTQYCGRTPQYVVDENNDNKVYLLKGVPFVNMDKLSKRTVKSENAVKVTEEAPVVA